MAILIRSEKVATEVGVREKQSRSLESSVVTEFVEHVGEVLVHEEGVVGVLHLVGLAAVAAAERIEDVLLRRLAWELLAIDEDRRVGAAVEADRVVGLEELGVALQDADLLVSDGDVERGLVDEHAAVDVGDDEVSIAVADFDDDGRGGDPAELVALDGVARIGQVDAEGSDAGERLDEERDEIGGEEHEGKMAEEELDAAALPFVVDRVAELGGETQIVLGRSSTER